MSAPNGIAGAEAASPNEHLAIVVPCYNAGARVRGVVEEALAVTRHVIVVDDGSTDGGVDALRDQPVQFVRFSENRGKGAALLAGFRAALDLPDVACTVVVDADGQHDPAEVPALYDAFVQHRADLVIGERTFSGRHVPWASWLGNRLTSLVTAALLRRRIPDTQSGCRLHARAFLESVVHTVPGGRYETEMAILIKAIRENRTIVSVPIKTIYDPGNRSSHFRNIRDSWRVWRVLFTNSLGAPRSA